MADPKIPQVIINELPEYLKPLFKSGGALEDQGLGKKGDDDADEEKTKSQLKLVIEAAKVDDATVDTLADTVINALGTAKNNGEEDKLLVLDNMNAKEFAAHILRQVQLQTILETWKKGAFNTLIAKRKSEIAKEKGCTLELTSTQSIFENLYKTKKLDLADFLKTNFGVMKEVDADTIANIYGEIQIQNILSKIKNNLLKELIKKVESETFVVGNDNPNRMIDKIKQMSIEEINKAIEKLDELLSNANPNFNALKKQMSELGLEGDSAANAKQIYAEILFDKFQKTLMTEKLKDYFSESNNKTRIIDQFKTFTKDEDANQFFDEFKKADKSQLAIKLNGLKLKVDDNLFAELQFQRVYDNLDGDQKEKFLKDKEEFINSIVDKETVQDVNDVFEANIKKFAIEKQYDQVFNELPEGAWKALFAPPARKVKFIAAFEGLETVNEASIKERLATLQSAATPELLRSQMQQYNLTDAEDDVDVSEKKLFAENLYNYLLEITEGYLKTELKKDVQKQRVITKFTEDTDNVIKTREQLNTFLATIKKPEQKKEELKQLLTDTLALDDVNDIAAAIFGENQYQKIYGEAPADSALKEQLVDAETKKTVIEKLGALDGPDAVPTLVEAVNSQDKSKHEIKDAMEALGLKHEEDAKLKAIYGSNQFRRVLTQETDGQTVLVEFLNTVDKDKNKKNKVIAAFGETDNSEGVKSLIDAVEKTEATKAEIVEAMKKMGFDDATQATIEPIFGSNQLIRIIVAEKNDALKNSLEQFKADKTKKTSVIKILGEKADAGEIDKLVKKVNDAKTIDETATALTALGLTVDKETVATIFAHAQHARLLKDHVDDKVLVEQLKDAKDNFVKNVVKLAIEAKEFSLFSNTNVDNLVTRLQEANKKETTEELMITIGLDSTDDSKAKALFAENIALQLINWAKKAGREALADRLKKERTKVSSTIAQINPVYDTNARTILGEILDPKSKHNKDTFKKYMRELGLETTNADDDVDPLYGEALYEGIVQDATRNSVFIEQLKAAKDNVIEKLGQMSTYEDARRLLENIEQADTLEKIKTAMEKLKLPVDYSKPEKLFAQNQFQNLIKGVDNLKQYNFYGEDEEPLYADIDETVVNPNLKRLSKAINSAYESIYEHLTHDQKKEFQQKLIEKRESYLIEDIEKEINDDLVYPLDSHPVLLEMLRALKPEKLREFKKDKTKLNLLMNANDEFSILQAIRDCELKTSDFKNAKAIHDIAEPFKDRLLLENKQHVALLRLTNSTLAAVLARYPLLNKSEISAAKLDPKTKKRLTQPEFELNIESLLNAKVDRLNAEILSYPNKLTTYETLIQHIIKVAEIPESADQISITAILVQRTTTIATKIQSQLGFNSTCYQTLNPTNILPTGHGERELRLVLARIEKKQELTDDQISKLIAAAKTANDAKLFFADSACQLLKDPTICTKAEKIITQEQFAYIKQQFVRDSLINKVSKTFDSVFDQAQKQLDGIADRYNDELKAAFMSLDKELNINPLEWINPQFEFKARHYAAESYERFQYLDKLTQEACIELRETISKLKALQASLPKEPVELGQLKTTRTFKKNDADKVLKMAAKLEDNIGIASKRLEAYEQFNLKLRGNPLAKQAEIEFIQRNKKASKQDLYPRGITEGYLGVVAHYKELKKLDKDKLKELEPDLERGISGYKDIDIAKCKTYSDIKKLVDDYIKHDELKKVQAPQMQGKTLAPKPLTTLLPNIGLLEDQHALIRPKFLSGGDSNNNARYYGVFYETRDPVKETKTSLLGVEVTQPVTLTVTHYPTDSENRYNQDDPSVKLNKQDPKRVALKTAQVDFATDIALHLLIRNGKAPTKDHPLLLSGTNTELVGLVWTALKELGKKLAAVDSEFGFDVDAMVVDSASGFDPSTQTNLVGRYKSESSYHAQFFSKDARSGENFNSLLDSVKTTFKVLKEEKKLKKMDDKEMTQFFKKALGEVKDAKNSPREGIEELDKKHGKGP